MLLLMQEEIQVEEISKARSLITDWSDDFERICVERWEDQIHFIRPCVHGLSHFTLEVLQIGPAIIYSQWTLEQTIRNLGEEIVQHSNPYAHLAQCGVHRSQINALKAMIPDILDEEPSEPCGARDAGGGYLLLPVIDDIA